MDVSKRVPQRYLFIARPNWLYRVLGFLYKVYLSQSFSPETTDNFGRDTHEHGSRGWQKPRNLSRPRVGSRNYHRLISYRGTRVCLSRQCRGQIERGMSVSGQVRFFHPARFIMYPSGRRLLATRCFNGREVARELVGRLSLIGAICVDEAALGVRGGKASETFTSAH